MHPEVHKSDTACKQKVIGSLNFGCLLLRYTLVRTAAWLCVLQLLLDCSVLIGGCDDVVALHKSGQLQLELEKALLHKGSSATALPLSLSSETGGADTVSAVDLHSKQPLRSLFWFPDVTDNR